jgi:hypothetical protein
MLPGQKDKLFYHAIQLMHSNDTESEAALAQLVEASSKGELTPKGSFPPNTLSRSQLSYYGMEI